MKKDVICQRCFPVGPPVRILVRAPSGPSPSHIVIDCVATP
jgi:hypothetical protein